MMRKVVLAVFVCLCSGVQAQLKIGGCSVCLDTLTNTLFATIPQRMFGTDARLMVEKEDGWQEVCIIPDGGATGHSGGVPVVGSEYPFYAMSAERKWAVTATRDDGSTLEASLQFTFLPIVQLIPVGSGQQLLSDGGFGYEYRPAQFLFSHPDSARTDTLSARIKWRGGTTNAVGKHKRNFKINFDEDHRFFGFRNDDKWMLDAGQPDVFRLRNRLAMDIWNSMARKPYYTGQEPKALNGVRGEMVEVFVGDEWRGIYNFSELIDRKQLKLKKMDEKTGEIRGCLYKGVSWDRTQMFNRFESYDNTKDVLGGYEMKYPELGDDSDTVDWRPLVEANNFAKSSTDEDFRQRVDDYFDMTAVMDYNIFYNVVNAVDNAGKNMYWAVYDKTKSQRLTPAPWDLDATFGQRWGGMLDIVVDEGSFTSPEFRLDLELMLTYRMFKDNPNNYIEQLNDRYQSLRQPGQPLHTDSLLALLTKYYRAVKDSGAAAREETKWSGDSDVWGDTIDFDVQYALIYDWIKRRMDFIDQTEFPLFYKQSYFDAMSISMPAASTTVSGQLYNLGGQRIGQLSGLRPGLYIRNGKKIFIGR